MKIFEISYTTHHDYLQGLNSSPWTPKNLKKSGRRKRGKKKKGKGGKKHRKAKNKGRARKSKTKDRVLGSNSLSPKKLNKYKSKKPKHFADLKNGLTSNLLMFIVQFPLDVLSEGSWL